MNRPALLQGLRTGETFDLLVIGGGATGLGTALDAVARGYTVALLERGDFACGTSSRSTKLVHGGVRYLSQGNISLVRSSLRERGRLARNAPHLVRKLAFVIPAYSVTDWLFYGAGLKLYEALAGACSLGPSRVLDRTATLARLPNVESTGLRGGVLYHDAQFDDARLALTLARSAADRGAVLLNHADVTAFVREGSRVVGVEVLDLISGAEFTVRARAVINATGVFVDALRRLEDAACAPLVTVSQGIHLVLPRRFLPGGSALMVPKTDDGRVLFAVPWHDRVIVGTTDTPRPVAETEPRALPEEIAFVLSHARRYLAEDPTQADVLSVFAGQRPLVRGQAGAATSRLSREHALEVGTGGVLTVTGGKWTTYREMAEQVVDLAARLGGLPPAASITADLRLRGAGENIRTVYGDDEPAVFASGAGAPLHPNLPYTEAEVRWAARHELAETVEDVLSRRTRALLLDARAASGCAPRVAEILAEELGRDAAWAEKQVAAFRELAAGCTPNA
ncbi:FAD-dependent oxidoreductase [Verrucomicrobia bacterium IMCC26134]|nr:FAD-dependent oxidoreductase [Verrucomicrobia bacterium IMCC26134]